jgi:hypothetical protein
MSYRKYNLRNTTYRINRNLGSSNSDNLDEPINEQIVFNEKCIIKLSEDDFNSFTNYSLHLNNKYAGTRNLINFDTIYLGDNTYGLIAETKDGSIPITCNNLFGHSKIGVMYDLIENNRFCLSNNSNLYNYFKDKIPFEYQNTDSLLLIKIY